MSIYMEAKSHTFRKAMKTEQKADISFRLHGKVVDIQAALKSFSAVYSDGERTIQTFKITVGTPELPVGRQRVHQRHRADRVLPARRGQRRQFRG